MLDPSTVPRATSAAMPRQSSGWARNPADRELHELHRPPLSLVAAAALRRAAMLKKTSAPDLDALRLLDERLRWLSAWTIHNANHLRESPDGLKVGGHQASCASMTAIMAALYFHALGPNDKVAVKPHAGPVLHAIHYLLGTPDPRAAREFPRLRRHAELSEPDQGQDPGRFLDRLGRPRGGGHRLRQPGPGLSRRPRRDGAGRDGADGRPDGRRRARRGQYLRMPDRGL